MLATLISRNANEDMVSPLVVSDGYAFGGSLESGSRYFIGVFVRNVATVAV